MKFEKTFFRVSFLETFTYFGVLLVIANVIAFVFTLIQGKPRLLLYSSSWIMQFIFPFLVAIIKTSVNRNGILRITMFDNLKGLTDEINSLVLKKSYVRIDKKEENLKYVRKAKLDRFFSNFFKEDVKVNIVNNEIIIYARKNLIQSIEMKLKYNHRN